jgi:hypothetical protein
MSHPSDFCIGCINDEYPEGLRMEIETQSATIASLRQQLAEKVELNNQFADYLGDAEIALTESQARVKVLRDALKYASDQPSNKFMWKGSTESNTGVTRCLAEIMPTIRKALALPADSTALDSAIKIAVDTAVKQAKREVAASCFRKPTKQERQGYNDWRNP